MGEHLAVAPPFEIKYQVGQYFTIEQFFYLLYTYGT